jgi:hypothetical protein
MVEMTKEQNGRRAKAAKFVIPSALSFRAQREISRAQREISRAQREISRAQRLEGLSTLSDGKNDAKKTFVSAHRCVKEMQRRKEEPLCAR